MNCPRPLPEVTWSPRKTPSRHGRHRVSLCVTGRHASRYLFVRRTGNSAVVSIDSVVAEYRPRSVEVTGRRESVSITATRLTWTPSSTFVVPWPLPCLNASTTQRQRPRRRQSTFRAVPSTRTTQKNRKNTLIPVHAFISPRV